MILSGVGLVAKCKAEKSRKQKEELKKKKATIELTGDDNVCEQCQIEERRARTHFQFPSRNSTAGSKGSSGYGSFDLPYYHAQSESVGELVSIATGEGHCIYVNQRCYTIDLLQDNLSLSSSHFRKRVLHREVGCSGEVETVVFSLDKEPDHYITTTKNKQLELNYFSEEPSLECPDERVFLVYTTNTNQKILQPIKFKGFYLHHLDNKLDITRFDINFRAPEEYFFQFDSLPDVSYFQETPLQPSSCTHRQTQGHTNTLVMVKATEKKNVKKKINIFSELFMTCVSSRSRKTIEVNSH